MSASVQGQTVVAIATPAGAGGVGVVRVSGPEAFSVLESVWRGRVRASDFQPRRLYLGEILSEFGIRDSEFGGDDPPSPESRVPSPVFIDKVLAVKMPAPHTYTGDDVVEISCHGSQPLLARVVEACVAAGARVAGPGEFTRRAFLAGKIDLAQAEAVCDLIAAESDRAARVAAAQLEGALSRRVRAAAGRVADARAQVEAAIDFPDEGIESGAHAAPLLREALESCHGLAATYESGRMIREGVRVAIVGRPNAGKSSLLNRIVGFDRALVHHAPGTTRDVVEASARIEGVAYTFCDTAGLRTAGCEVETLGIERSEAELARADLALIVFDGSRGFSDDDREAILRAEGKRALFVVNKSDLPCRFDIKALGAEPLRVSALTGSGMDALAERVARESAGGGACAEGVVVSSARHKALLEEAAASLEAALAEIAADRPAELAAQRLRAAHEALGAITGEAATEEMLDRIFSKFCIGK